MKSLRRTSLIWMTALLTIVGIIAFIVSYELARRESDDFLDGQLRQIALNVGEGPAVSNVPVEKRDPEDEFAISIWNGSGELLRQSTVGVALPRQPKSGYATIRHEGEDWRVFLASDLHRAVQVGQRMIVRQEMAETSAIQTGVPFLLVIPLTWLIIGWGLGQVFGRLKGLANSIAERSVDSRETIPVTDIPAELQPLVAGMNVLIGRLQQALERQKRFVADAAHELRTPLTALQLQIDNLHASVGDGVASPSISELRDGIRRATTLVEQLLRLARTEQTIEPKPDAEVDLLALVTQSIGDFSPVAFAKNVDLGLVANDRVKIRGSSTDLRILVDNLIDNAVRYTPAGGSVDVSVRREGDTFSLEVVDTGCGVAQADIPRLCDRFFRAAPLEVEGSGLGLSIVDAIAKRHELTIFIGNRVDRNGLRVIVTNGPAEIQPGETDRSAQTSRQDDGMSGYP